MDVEKTLFIDDRYDSYESFFDHDWAKVISSQVTGTSLAPSAIGITNSCGFQRWNPAMCHWK